MASVIKLKPFIVAKRFIAASPSIVVYLGFDCFIACLDILKGKLL
jgi:hypothetical protein